jgi:hypothetical protein
MLLSVALTLWLSLPAAPPPPTPAGSGAAPPHVAEAVARWRATLPKERSLDALGTHATAERAVAAFIDRSGGCLRGWARLTLVFAKDRSVASQDATDYLGAACDAPASPLDMLLRLDDAIRTKRWVAVAEYLPNAVHFSIASDDKGKRGRKTYDGAQALAGKVPFPACDPLQDLPACDAPRDSGRVTCRCTGPERELEIDFQLDAEEPGKPQLLAIREKRS